MHFTRTFLGVVGTVVTTTAAAACQSGSGEEVCEPQVELIDRSTQALGTGALQWVDGTYGAGCATHTDGEAWSLRIRGSTAMTNPALSVVKGDSDCVLTVTGLMADAIYTAAPSIALGTSYKGTASAFTKAASALGFYANARISATTFAANFTVTIVYSNDLASVSPSSTATYASYTATAGGTAIPAPDYTVSFAGLDVQATDAGAVSAATGSAGLTTGTQAGQTYVVAGAISATYDAVDAAYLAGTAAAVAATIPASAFTLVGQMLPVTRTLIVANTSNGVRSYQVVTITFKSPCSGTLMCDDFERSTVQGEWDYYVPSGGATLSISTTRALAGTRSLRLDAPSAEAAYAQLQKVVPRSGNLTIRYSVYIESTFPARTMTLSAIRHHESGRELEAFFIVDGAANTISAVEQEWTASYYRTIASTTLVKGRWVQLEVHINRSVSPWLATYTYDGVKIVDAVALNRSVSTAGTARADVGLGWVSAGTATYVHIDNAAISNP